MMSEYVFGQPISKSEADKLFENFIRIKQRTAGILQEALKGDEEALRYYCGRKEKNPVLEDWAYVFNKASLQHVMKKIDSGEADGVFIFHGMRHAAPNVTQAAYADASDASAGETSGKPIMMIFPAKYIETTDEDAIGFMLLAGDGVEHPGTGGGEITTVDAEEIKLPESFKKRQYR